MAKEFIGFFPSRVKLLVPPLVKRLCGSQRMQVNQPVLLGFPNILVKHHNWWFAGKDAQQVPVEQQVKVGPEQDTVPRLLALALAVSPNVSRRKHCIDVAFAYRTPAPP
jgi:hypothetical protein